MDKRQSSSLDDSLQAIFQYWNIQPDGGQCQSATDVVLWFVSIWVASGLWTLVLGNRDIQSFVRKKLDFKSPFPTRLGNFICACTGSFIFHFSMTIATGYVLGGSDNLLNPILAWCVRPLPTLPTVTLAMFDAHAFENNNRALFTVEILYSFFPIALIGQVASLALPLSQSASDPSQGLTGIVQAISLLQSGAGIDITAWVLTLFYFLVILGMGMAEEKDNMKRAMRACKPVKYPFILVCFTFLRLIGGVLLWSGGATVFCPKDYMITLISVIWGLVVPLVDNLWFAVFAFDK